MLLFFGSRIVDAINVKNIIVIIIINSDVNINARKSIYHLYYFYIYLILEMIDKE